jgi:hypothetical protein
MYLCWHKEHTTHEMQETDPAATTDPSENHCTLRSERRKLDETLLLTIHPPSFFSSSSLEFIFHMKHSAAKNVQENETKLAFCVYRLESKRESEELNTKQRNLPDDG